MKEDELLMDYRIEELEKQLGAGLIEEVIEVAKGENSLVDVMVQNRV